MPPTKQPGKTRMYKAKKYPRAYCLNIKCNVCTVFESENKGILFKKHQISYYLGLLGRKDP